MFSQLPKITFAWYYVILLIAYCIIFVPFPLFCSHILAPFLAFLSFHMAGPSKQSVKIDSRVLHWSKVNLRLRVSRANVPITFSFGPPLSKNSGIGSKRVEAQMTGNIGSPSRCNGNLSQVEIDRDRVREPWCYC